MLQVRVRLRVAPPVQPTVVVAVSSSPGVHSLLPGAEQVLQAFQEPHSQVALQLRVRSCMPRPQAPQSRCSLPISPGKQLPPSPTHMAAPQRQSEPQTSTSVPHAPQGPSIRISPGVQAPLLHSPSSVQRPRAQICRWVPHRAQSMVRGASPSVQSQVVGALQGSQTPSVQRSTPPPQSLEQRRSRLLPAEGSRSSQSTSEGMPSLSRSSSGLTQRPEMHSASPVHGGEQGLGPASAEGRPPASPGLVPPVAQPIPKALRRLRHASHPRSDRGLN